MILSAKSDPMGNAILDYATHGKALHQLCVKSTLFDDDEMPVDNLFRTELQMPTIERTALHLCKGNVLDVGAGAGCHTLVLEQKGLNVTSIDISPLSTQVRQMRGAKHALCADFFTDNFGNNFTTILMLMNGLGIAGKLENLASLLLRCKELLAEDGKILADSSDLRYIFEDEDEDDISTWNSSNNYYGEVDFQMVYGNCIGKCFDWLYVDFSTLNHIAKQCGMQANIIKEGAHYDYLAEIRLK